MILGITGTDGAGKGTVVDYLVKTRGFVHYQVRALLTQEIEKEGLENNRAMLRTVANNLRRELGNDAFVKLFLKEAKEKGDTDIIIDSIRTVAEAETLKQSGGILLCVDADRKVRYERIKKRGSVTDHVSFDEFVLLEEREMNDPDPSGMQKAKVMKMADYCFENNVSIKNLHIQVDAFLKKATG
jgi:dephospho-CoA kinase